jgi:hypothetical protein
VTTRAAARIGVPMVRLLGKDPVCHPDDARRVIDGGVDGVYCSNHGVPEGSNHGPCGGRCPRVGAIGRRGENTVRSLH